MEKVFLPESETVKKQNLAEQVFIVVPDESGISVIKEFCETFFSNRSETDRGEPERNRHEAVSGMAELETILQALPRPYTIIQETYHIDKSYRDTYYMYFSNQHFHTDRYSRRLSFVRGIVGYESFFSMDEVEQDNIRKAFMGSCVINPVVSGAIGRTLISPQWLLGEVNLPTYIKLSKFKAHVMGKEFSVRAFPFRMQDQETMRCTEVTLLNLLEFYSNSYDDYKSVVPRDIIESEQRHSYERVLPSRGISYPVLTKVLSDFGFSPRLYNVNAIEKFHLSQISQDDELKRWLHYYIESGIPVALNLLPASGNAPGHSMVCIGHGPEKDRLINEAFRRKQIRWSKLGNCHPIINSADFFEDYVVVDDNQPVYQMRNYRQLAAYPDMRVVNIAAPLYKRMFLDAPDAASIITTLLQEEECGISEWTKDFLEENEDVIIRLFMTSCSSFKSFRKKTLSSIWVREVYTVIPMPRFVWVCELYRRQDYFADRPQAFGEIVIDATSGANRGRRCLIMAHYPKVILVRNPQQAESGFDEIVKLKSDALFPGYAQNLDKFC